MICEHPQHIVNRYSGRIITVGCRECPSCLALRSSRLAERIRNQFSPDYNHYFVTLSYDNAHVPFVVLDGDGCSDILSFREVADGSHYPPLLKSPSVIRPLSSFHPDKLTKFDDKLPYFKKVWKLPNFPIRNAVAVHNYDDSQLFLKRLRKYLYSHGYIENFKFHCSAEYGETTYRPHLHYLFTTKIPTEVFKEACMSCWQYCDFDKLPRWFEVAISPAKYLSSYLGDSHFLPYFYRSSIFRQRFTHSLHYGFENPSFALPSFYAAAQKGVVEYVKEYFTKQGQFVHLELLYPSYVTNRWFPQIKGFSRLNFNEFLSFGTLLERVDDKPFEFFVFSGPGKQCFSVKQVDFSPYVYSFLVRLAYNSDDVKRTVSALNRMRFFASQLDVSFVDYLVTYYKFYSRYNSQLIINSHKHDIDYLSTFAFYDDVNFNSDVSLFVDTDGVFHAGEISDYLQNNTVIQSLLTSYRKKSSDSKYIKKVKSSTLNYYHNG